MRNRPTMNQIAQVTCEVINVHHRGKSGVLSPKRGKRLCYARAMIVYIGQFYEYTYDEIAASAGYANHSGAIFAERRLVLGHYGDDWQGVSGKIVKRLDN